MREFVILSAFCVILFLSKNYARILYVPGTFPSIQSAIDNSVNGDTIIVERGRYFENINLKGKQILLASRFFLTNDITDIQQTIIDGSQPRHPDTASCVLMISGETRNTILEGFTITGGKGTAWTDEHGAGIYYEGGGILTAYSSPIIRNNFITNNEAIRKNSQTFSAGGGGLRMGDSNPLVINNIFFRNKAMYGGGLVANYAHNAEIRNNLFIENTVYQAVQGATTFGGGGIWINATTDILVINNTIIGNSSSGSGTTFGGKGGGVLCMYGIATLRNNIIYNNTQVSGNDVYVRFGGINAFYNNVSGGISGTGNINLNPQLENGIFVPMQGSPCIDAGSAEVIYNDMEDPANPGNPLYPAKGTLRNDLGAYGGSTPMFIFQLITGIENSDGGSLTPGFRLFPNFPNPFNSTTKIRFTVEDFSSMVSLKVYNILGDEIETLINENLSPGMYSADFNASKLTSGIYFTKLEAGNFCEIIKMVYIK